MRTVRNKNCFFRIECGPLLSAKKKYVQRTTLTSWTLIMRSGDGLIYVFLFAKCSKMALRFWVRTDGFKRGLFSYQKSKIRIIFYYLNLYSWALNLILSLLRLVEKKQNRKQSSDMMQISQVSLTNFICHAVGTKHIHCAP